MKPSGLEQSENERLTAPALECIGLAKHFGSVAAVMGNAGGELGRSRVFDRDIYSGCFFKPLHQRANQGLTASGVHG